MLRSALRSRLKFLRAIPACVLSLGSLTSAWAVQPSETLLPATTKGYISTQDVNKVRSEFSKTQLGQMASDAEMAPFIDDLKRQIAGKMEQAGAKLGVKFEDLEKVYAGEVSLSVVQPDPKNKQSHAMVLTVDVTGKSAEVDALLQKVAAAQTAKKAVRSMVKSPKSGMNIIMYTQPIKKGETQPERSYYFVHEDMLIASDHFGVIDGIAGRFGAKEPKDTLATVKAFEYTMSRSEKEKGEIEHHVRWFVEPFGFAEARRAAEGGKKKRGTDLLKILQQQGFTAIQGAGGYVFLNTGNEEVLHRTFVYAPPVHETGEKYDLAARMLQFPNGGNLGTAQNWALPTVGAYLTFNIKAQDAFKFSETLVDAYAGQPEVFKEMWQSLKIDPQGPQIDIYGGLVNHLGERCTVMSDILLPVTTTSERNLTAIEISNPAIVAKTIEKAFASDPTAKKLTYAGETIWQVTNDEESAASPELSIEGAGFVSVESEAEDAGAAGAKALVSAYSVMVFQGHLVVSTHTSFLQEVIDGATKGADVSKTPDYQRVATALARLGSANDSFRYFAQTEESYRVTYELLKQNKLPQGESVFAKLINGVAGEAEKAGTNRQQAIDGSKLPDFDKMKQYLGPTGLYGQSEDDGWKLVGVLLKKQPEVKGTGIASDRDENSQATAPAEPDTRRE